MSAADQTDFVPEVLTPEDRATEAQNLTSAAPAAAMEGEPSGTSYEAPQYEAPQPAPAPVAPTPTGAAVASDAKSETERLDPQPTEMRLISGTEYELEPLKLRQFLRLLRIITKGAADVLDSTNLDFNDGDAFVQQFIGMILFSIPEAEDETIDFIRSMVRPKITLTGNAKIDNPKVNAFYQEIDNPELEDTITIVQTIIEAEAEDIRALGKRLGSMLRVAEKMGATQAK